MLTTTILKVDILPTELLDLLYNQCIHNTCLYSFFIYPTGLIRVCKIRFVSAGENRGKPCRVCKKTYACCICVFSPIIIANVSFYS